MTFLRFAVCSTVAAAGLACGPEFTEPVSESSANPAAAPVELLPIVLTPGCYAEATPLEDVTLDPLFAQRVEMAVMQASFDSQYVALLNRPILEEPMAEQWTGREDERHYTARSLIRGHRWGLIEAGLEWETEFNGERWLFTYRASISYTHNRTSYAMELTGDSRRDFNVQITPDALLLGAFGRTCNEEFGVVLDLLPHTLAAGNAPLQLVCRKRVPDGEPASENSCRYAAEEAWGADVPYATVELIRLP